MNKFWDYMKKETNWTSTENGAGAYNSTMNACLDMFGALGAMRHSSDADIISLFKNAFNENPDFAVKMAFYFRDIRGGQGTRRQFRVIMKWLAENSPKYVINNLSNFMEYGRGDDFLCLLDTDIAEIVIKTMMSILELDYKNMKAGKPVSLLSKWMPSVNASSSVSRHYALQICKTCGWSSKMYRKLLSKLRAYLDVVEVKMSAQQWQNINYEAVPSKASMIYNEAFYRHDIEGYDKYLRNVANGQAKVNAGALYPVDIIHKIFNDKITQKDRLLYDAMWNNLPNYFGDKEETGICVVDTSGSMYGEPMDVAISLGLYCADKCRGPFANKFITFSSKPALIDVQGADIVSKAIGCTRADWMMNTNLEAVFDLILKTAVANDTPNSDLPKKLYIISDMQFDEATGINRYSRYGVSTKHKHITFMAQMKQRFALCGYDMPAIVYWNVRASKCGMFQETVDGENCCMVSGYSPSLFKAVINGTTYTTETMVAADGQTIMQEKQTIDPINVMLTAIRNERYDAVWTTAKDNQAINK